MISQGTPYALVQLSYSANSQSFKSWAAVFKQIGDSDPMKKHFSRSIVPKSMALDNYCSVSHDLTLYLRARG